MAFRLDESRRLTGANLFTDSPGAVLEIYVDAVEHTQLIEEWQKQLQYLLSALGLRAELFHRRFTDGVSLGFSADEDMLYSACEINEAALELARVELNIASSESSIDSEMMSIERLQQLVTEERNPTLMALIKEANRHQVTYLVDDDEFSLGMGCNSQTWAIDQLPKMDALQWQNYQAIPVALITGTNGKSTTVRLCDGIIKASGVCVGITSTDYIRAAETILDQGDYSGPGGARMLIRDHRVEIAVLEVARGGMLRRGLGISSAKAALITNVADDHLGQYGINTVAELIAVKAIVSRSIAEDGTLVVNADDQGLVDYFQQHPELIRGKICWFSLDPANEKIAEQRQQQQPCVWLQRQQIWLEDAGIAQSIMAVSDIPITINGLAKYNIANCLGAVGLCHALGIHISAMVTGLKNFQGNNLDNPGRGNYFNINGATLLIDFAHNAHSLAAVIDTLKAIPATRRLIMLGHAGDRSDRDINNLTDVAIGLCPDRVITAEIPDYLRGRNLGEIPTLIRQRCIDSGIDATQIISADSCLQGAEIALDWIQPGDLIVLLALDQREDIFALIENSFQPA